jgi:hypothetical protein
MLRLLLERVERISAPPGTGILALFLHLEAYEDTASNTSIDEGISNG